jgi:ABC-type transporter Mla maintaining outer membrane lipid asymmetry ATPase subunit MlaF/ABC-type transporter Mla maintaining outer membrane lipid asymmetry permease subunit MlaE
VPKSEGSAAASEPTLLARDLGVRVGGATLLAAASFELRAGELLLLCGPSGAGKTVLLKLLAGVVRPGEGGLEAEGTLRFESTDLLAERPPAGRVGVLFQNHALFDELTARENVLFALRHRAGGANGTNGVADDGAAERLLADLGVAGVGALRHLSGGQLQRVALARTLALDPDLVLYDEPTTGLDPANAARVATTIRAVHQRRERTTLVVTHDLEAFRGIASGVLWLDPARRTVERLSLDAAIVRTATLAETDGRGGAVAPPSLPVRLLERTADALDGGALALRRLVPSWPRARYGLRYLAHYLRLAGSVGAFLYVGVAGLLLGFVATYFSFEKMPKRGFTEPLFNDEFLSALGFMLFRVLSPLLVTLLVAARTGAAFSADVGGKVHARQFDALRSFGVEPSRYLLTGMQVALLVAMPFLVWTMWWAAELSSCAVYLWTHPDRGFPFWDRAFHRALVNEDFLLQWGWKWVLAKTEACAYGIAATAWFVGAREKSAPEDVSRGVTRTVIVASLWTLFVHFLFSFFEYANSPTS